MTSCARGCCWSPYGCGKARECGCHWGDWLHTQPASEHDVKTYRNPTQDKAIANVMRQRGRKPK